MSFPAARKRRSRGDEFSRDANIYFTNIYFCSRNAIRGIDCGVEYFNILPGALTGRSMREPPYLPKGARWRKRLAENLCEPLPSGRKGRKADIRGVRGTKFSGIPEGWWDFQTRDLPRARNFRSYSIGSLGSIGVARYRYVDRADSLIVSLGNLYTPWIFGLPCIHTVVRTAMEICGLQRSKLRR